MTRIGVLSDTHGLLDKRIFEHFKDVDEIWHAGDIGSFDMDSGDVRYSLSEFYRFRVEDVQVLMTHIGGYPGHYNPWLIPMFQKEPPDLFVCGHSHILKVIYDKQWNFLTMNPGAAGKQGWQTVQTLLRFTINGKQIEDLEVVELGKK